MHIRVDFGRVLPGLFLFISGLVLLIVLLIVALVSWLFSFIPVFSGILHGTLILMLLPVLIIAGGIIVVLTGVSWGVRGREGRFSGIARDRALKDRLSFLDTVGELIGAAVSLLVFLFLRENHLRGIAFFTAGFGIVEQFFFYGPMIVGVVLSLARVVFGRHNEIRPFDSLNALFMSVAAFWLLSMFPFNFNHLADMFPQSIQFIFGWLSNDIGRFLFILTGVLSLVNFVYTAFLYSAIKDQLQR